MLVGYIIHNSVTEGGDNGWWCVQDGPAIFEQSLALQRHFILVNTPELCMLWLLSFPLKRVAREVPVQVNLEIVALVLFLFCVLFFIIYLLVLLLLILSSTPCFSWVLNTVWYNDSNMVLPGLPVGISVTAQMGVEETCNFLLTCVWNTKWIIQFFWKKNVKLVKIKEKILHNRQAPPLKLFLEDFCKLISFDHYFASVKRFFF